jgi:hypothetical protein
MQEIDISATLGATALQLQPDLNHESPATKLWRESLWEVWIFC